MELTAPPIAAGVNAAEAAVAGCPGEPGPPSSMPVPGPTRWGAFSRGRRGRCRGTGAASNADGGMSGVAGQVGASVKP